MTEAETGATCLQPEDGWNPEEANSPPSLQRDHGPGDALVQGFRPQNLGGNKLPLWQARSWWKSFTAAWQNQRNLFAVCAIDQVNWSQIVAVRPRTIM